MITEKLEAMPELIDRLVQAPRRVASLRESGSGGILAGALRHLDLKQVVEMPQTGRVLLGLGVALAGLVAIAVARAGRSRR